MNDIENGNISLDSSSSSSHSILTSSNNTSGQCTESSSASSMSLAKEESLFVSRTKKLVLAVIFVAAAVCGAATYILTKASEEETFRVQFDDFATQIEDLSHLEAEHIVGTITSLSATITSFSLSSNVSFPQVTIPHFEMRGALNNKISYALQLTFAPLVKRESKEEWQAYALANQGWIDESMALKKDLLGGNLYDDDIGYFTEREWSPISPNVFRYEDYTDGPQVVQLEDGIDFGPGHYAPVWQQAPSPQNTSIINFDLLSHPVFARIYHGMWESSGPVLSEVTKLDFLFGGASELDGVDRSHPHSFLLDPVYPSFNLQHKDHVVGIIVAVLPWDTYFEGLLHEGAGKINIVLHNSCGDHFTYAVTGPSAVYQGKGDLHDHKYDQMKRTTEFAPFLNKDFSEEHDHCLYDLQIFPTDAMKLVYTTNKPILYTIIVVLIFFCTAMAFVSYDYYVSLRQNKVMATTKRTNAIVSSLFPKNVRERLMEDAKNQAEQELLKKPNKKNSPVASAKAQLREFLGEGDGQTRHFATPPIADLFPSATVMFADIVGFTAWSSVREACQVFTLLETVYQAFDEIAKRRRVFKVETIGDCYVAVAGLPDKRKDHAVTMCRFARDCLNKINSLVRTLETTLGPETGALTMRFGLHTGPVTAGVLRGEKGRFQLFGDTVNTAARIESTGERGRIHLSQETADIVSNSGKSAWIEKRSECVRAKGKGELQTYWLHDSHSASSTKSGSTASSEEVTSASMKQHLEDIKWVEAGLRPTNKKEMKKMEKDFCEKTHRLVDWNTDVLSRLLKQIVARRNATKKSFEPLSEAVSATAKSMVIDEVVEIVELPEYNPTSEQKEVMTTEVVLEDEVAEQLHVFVDRTAALYLRNPFHNFEHASHVAMSVTKLLSRIVAPSDILDSCKDEAVKDLGSTLHDHTYGITSDPLTQFACVFSALIHDVDHSGVPNAQLVAEKAPVALAYTNRSVAEQNSVDISWAMLMQPEFDNLRSALCATQSELKRFRQLVVNAVIATDIADKELKTLRNARWANAFDKKANANESDRQKVNRKATIVIEHLIQASDISHTMQHWHIYRKWNERLFCEQLKAYRSGRADTDPAEFWYKGELGFFDYYIIPLAKKLKECGVFGVSSDEFLNYALQNRVEWEARGKEVLAGMIEKYKLGSNEAPTAMTREITLLGNNAGAVHHKVGSNVPFATQEITLSKQAGTSAKNAPVPKRVSSSRQLVRSDSLIFTAKSA